MTGFLAAVQFLTLLPVKRNFTAEQVGRSTVYFPLVGLMIGLILAGFNWLISLILPPSVVNVLLVALLAILSGGLHLDGTADTLDGIAGHRTPEQRLEIMRDSRIGGFGAIGLALLLLVEYVSLNSIPGNIKWQVLILAPVLSRWAMVNAIFVYPYARPSGLGRSFKDAVNRQQFAISTVIAIVLSIALFRLAGIAVLAGCWIVINLAALYLKRQLKGLTGDTYGAINEAGLISVLLIVSMLSFKHWLI
jgi:adenosylcobinamide-GDP ribazoletransferase